MLEKNSKIRMLTTLVILALLTAFLSNDLYLPSMPLLAQYFSVNANIMQITVTAWFAGAMTLQLVLGPLSDAFGRKPLLVSSLILLAIGSAICAFAPNITAFIFGRFLEGVAASGIMVTSYAAVHEGASSGTQATKLLGYVGMCSAAAPVAGPLIGGYVSAYLGWAMNFYLVILLSILSASFIGRTLPESNAKKTPVHWEKLIGTYKMLIKNQRYMLTVSSYAFMFFAGGAFLGGIAFIMVDILQQPVQHVGYAIFPLLIIYMFTAGLTGHLVKLISPKNIILISLTLATVSMIVFFFASILLKPSLTLIITCIGLYYAGLGLSGPHLNHISLSCSEENKGYASAFLTMSMMLGCTAGTFLLSLIYNNQFWSLPIVMLISVFIALVCYIIYLVGCKKIITQKTTTDPS